MFHCKFSVQLDLEIIPQRIKSNFSSGKILRNKGVSQTWFALPSTYMWVKKMEIWKTKQRCEVRQVILSVCERVVSVWGSTHSKRLRWTKQLVVWRGVEMSLRSESFWKSHINCSCLTPRREIWSRKRKLTWPILRSHQPVSLPANHLHLH